MTKTDKGCTRAAKHDADQKRGKTFCFECGAKLTAKTPIQEVIEHYESGLDSASTRAKAEKDPLVAARKVRLAAKWQRGLDAIRKLSGKEATHDTSSAASD